MSKEVDWLRVAGICACILFSLAAWWVALRWLFD